MERENYKDIYLELLQDLLDGLSSRQEQLNITYTKAKANLTATEGVFRHPKDLKKVKGIGDTIVNRLESKLDDYCRKHGIAFPRAPEPTGRRKQTTGAAASRQIETALRMNSDIAEEAAPARKKRKYIPKQKSGGYAILLGLLELNAVRRSFTKDHVVEVAQKYSSSSMSSNFATKEFYSAWTSVNSLLKHSLVLEEGRPKRYSLTPEGLELANTLKSADGIKFSSDTNDARAAIVTFDTENEHTVDLSHLLQQEKSIQRFDHTQLNTSSLGALSQHLHSDPVASTQSSTPRGSKVRQDLPLRNDIQGPQQTRLFDTGSTNKVHMSRNRFNGVSYEFWKRGSYEVYPIIDHREVKSRQDREFFSDALHTKGVKSEVRQLSLGDIVWVARHRATGFLCVLNTIIERKRLDDLAASIRDNRFMEQKARLEKSGCLHKYYLIEETMTGNNMVLNMTEALKTSLWTILLYYRFSVIRSTNSTETVEKLCALHRVIKHDYSKKDLVVMYPSELHDQDDYKRVLERFTLEFGKSEGSKTSVECCHTLDCFQEIMGKNDLRTVGEAMVQLLMYVRGVSLEKAVAIQAHYPTPRHLLEAYSRCKSATEANLMLFQKLGEAPGAKRITKGLSERIAEAFV